MPRLNAWRRDCIGVFRMFQHKGDLMKALLTLIVTLVSVSAFSKTLRDVKAADCTTKQGSYLRLDTKTNLIVGRLGKLNEMTNAQTGERPTLEISEGYPAKEFAAIGFLAADKNGYWGNLSLLAPKDAPLDESARLKGYFMDMNGKGVVEDMDCQLKF